MSYDIDCSLAELELAGVDIGMPYAAFLSQVSDA
jgi:hypothetical protein